MTFMELARDRYSVRKFSDKAVEKEKIDAIIEAGKVAPTAKNYQPQIIYIIKSEDALAKINEISPCIYGAPVVLLICYDADTVWKNSRRPGYDTGEVDASIVGTHMMLEAWEQGIGSCWVGVFNDQDIIKAFELPENIKPVALLPIGYAAEGSEPAPMHDTFKEISDFVKEL